MNSAATEARRAYKRSWAKRNPDKVKAQQERYWQKRAAAAANAEQPGTGSEQSRSTAPAQD